METQGLTQIRRITRKATAKDQGKVEKTGNDRRLAMSGRKVVGNGTRNEKCQSRSIGQISEIKDQLSESHAAATCRRIFLKRHWDVFNSVEKNVEKKMVNIRVFPFWAAGGKR